LKGKTRKPNKFRKVVSCYNEEKKGQILRKYDIK